MSAGQSVARHLDDGTYLKQADPRPAAENSDIRDIVQIMLARIEREGEAAVCRYPFRPSQYTPLRRGSDGDGTGM